MTKRETFRAVLTGISVPFDAAEEQVIQQARERMKRAGVDPAPLHFRLYKKSVDARRRGDIRFVCSVLAEGEGTAPDEKLARAGAKRLASGDLSIRRGQAPLAARPLVVGMGPAGMFAALLLAEHGMHPILIDRGDSVADRVRAVERFYRDGVLDTESNIQFGAGGAGTFSDGKLLTRIHDARCAYVLDTLVRFGAPDEILTKAKPHVGTDILRVVVDNLLSEVTRLGGEVRYRCRMDRISELADGTLDVTTSKGHIHAGCAVLALGNSPRDTYYMMLGAGYAIEPKPISVGVRIEHLQSDIDRALYGDKAGHPALGHAEYALSDTTRARGVYTFCMCPGGEVVAGASEEGGLVVNGMSRYARDGKNANCAVAVSLGISDYEPVGGSVAAGAIELQRRIERAAFCAGGGGYRAPIQTVGDFLAGKTGTSPRKVLPTYRGGDAYTLADLGTVFPSFVREGLAFALHSFDRKLHGFADPEAVLTAAETRTSAPLRILRGEDMTAPGHPLIYPIGEGAGYAGGITSAAVDGVRAAEQILSRFKDVRG